MNINKTVLDYGNNLNLMHFQTGGGCDYLGYSWPHLSSADGWGACLIVGGAELSPDTLEEAATVTVYSSDDWSNGWASFQFKNAKEALKAVADQDTRAAMLWLSLDAFVDPEIVTEKIELFTHGKETLRELFNKTMHEYSEIIAKENGFSMLELWRPEVYKKQSKNPCDQPGLANELQGSMIKTLNDWAAYNGLIVDCSADEFLIENMQSLTTEQKAFLTAYVEMWTNSNI